MEKQQEKQNSGTMSGTGTIDFTGLVLGLSGAALSYLGHLSKQDDGNSPVNLDLVKQNIEILTMLTEKTKGNLNSDEERILRQVVADLQFRYIEAFKASPR